MKNILKFRGYNTWQKKEYHPSSIISMAGFMGLWTVDRKRTSSIELNVSFFYVWTRATVRYINDNGVRYLKGAIRNQFSCALNTLSQMNIHLYCVGRWTKKAGEDVCPWKPGVGKDLLSTATSASPLL